MDQTVNWLVLVAVAEMSMGTVDLRVWAGLCWVDNVQFLVGWVDSARAQRYRIFMRIILK